MKTIVATIVRNEAPRYLSSALSAWASFADEILAIDNASTDETPSLLEGAGALILEPCSDEPMWGAEAAYRRSLFTNALYIAEPDDVLLFLDADMTPARDPTRYFSSGEAFFFPLYDLWQTDPLRYRDEPPYWRAAHSWRPWALRASYARTIHVSAIQRPIHCGHIPPLDPPPAASIWLPPDCGMLHYGYSTSTDRLRASQRYARTTQLLTPLELDHAATITDADPNLAPLDFEPELTLERAASP